MAVFFLAEVETIHDTEKYTAYTEQVPAIVERHGGSYVVKSRQCTAVSGSWNTVRVVMIRFETLAQLHACFQSEEYKAIAHFREESITGKALIIEE